MFCFTKLSYVITISWRELSQGTSIERLCCLNNSLLEVATLDRCQQQPKQKSCVCVCVCVCGAARTFVLVFDTIPSAAAAAVKAFEANILGSAATGQAARRCQYPTHYRPTERSSRRFAGQSSPVDHRACSAICNIVSWHHPQQQQPSQRPTWTTTR